MKKVFVIAYSLVCYIIGLGAVAYYFDFFVGLYVPWSINGPVRNDPMWERMVVNLLLIGLFSLQHTIMARPSVKRIMRKVVPFALERSTYVLLSSISLFLLCFFWRPIPVPVLDVRDTILEPVLWSLYATGWAIGLFSTFLIDHFDLFGLKQAWFYGKNKTFSYQFITPLLYKFVRHPIYLGWLMVHWFTPYLTAGHFLLALAITVYILVAIPFEERDLEQFYGETYRQYKASTPSIIPGVLKRKNN